MAVNTLQCASVRQALEHREAALKLAEHWKEEAIKQAKFAQVSNWPLICTSLVCASRRAGSL